MYLTLAYSKPHVLGSASYVDKDTIFIRNTFSRAALLIALISTFGASVPMIPFVLWGPDPAQPVGFFAVFCF